MPITLVDPTTSAAETVLRPARRPVGPGHTVAALVGNGKPNSDVILRGVFGELSKRLEHPVEALEFTKESASRVLSEEMTNLIARRCHFALVGVGD
ncbi:MAG: hypothetical protein OXH02_06850 [Gemmatimonadetes bacterium]|nr:hypothetical protein [Gemmatimonadota bacterium]